MEGHRMVNNYYLIRAKKTNEENGDYDIHFSIICLGQKVDRTIFKPELTEKGDEINFDQTDQLRSKILLAADYTEATKEAMKWYAKYVEV